jgi:hypothetical protein
VTDVVVRGTGRGALRAQRFGAWYESSDTARDRQSRANRVRGPEELGRFRPLGYLGLRRVRGRIDVLDDAALDERGAGIRVPGR